MQERDNEWTRRLCRFVVLLLVGAACAQDGKKLSHEELPPPKKPLAGVAVDAKGENVYLATTGGVLYAWDAKKKVKRWQGEFELPPKVRLKALAGKEPGSFVVSMAAGSKTLVLGRGMSVAFTAYDLTTGKKVGGHGGPPRSDECTVLVCDPRDRWTWLGTNGGAVTRLFPRKVKGFWTRELGNMGVTSMALDGKGNNLAVGGSDGSIRFVNPKSAKVDKKKVTKIHSEPVTALAWGPPKQVHCER